MVYVVSNLFGKGGTVSEAAWRKWTAWVRGSEYTASMYP